MNVTVIGTGYVGLTTGVVLGYLGHQVICLDVDKTKIKGLNDGTVPIYEPGLEQLLQLAEDNLTFTTRYEDAVPNADVIFIAVGTPSMPDGNPNLEYVRDAAYHIGQNLGEGFTVVVNKSTVPIGSGNWVEALIRDSFETRNGRKPFGTYSVASNPEFLREGTALFDTFYADRIVLGSDDHKAVEIMTQLYQPIIDQTFYPPAFLPRPEGLERVPLVTTDLSSAELIKYSANAFLSLKISFINEIADLAERVGADTVKIASGIGLDSRIGSKFLDAGIGWGGSCFGKDTAALVATAKDYSLSMPIIEAARVVNYRLRSKVVNLLLRELKILKGKSVGILGLAFKANTDDLRDSPALDIASMLIAKGAKVIVHDPVAVERAKREVVQVPLHYAAVVEDVFEGTDAVILATEWPHYYNLPWSQLISKMKSPIILDGRNFLDGGHLTEVGFKYMGMGR